MRLDTDTEIEAETEIEVPERSKTERCPIFSRGGD
jgi:hypothetical protein